MINFGVDLFQDVQFSDLDLYSEDAWMSVSVSFNPYQCDLSPLAVSQSSNHDFVVNLPLFPYVIACLEVELLDSMHVTRTNKWLTFSLPDHIMNRFFDQCDF